MYIYEPQNYYWRSWPQNINNLCMKPTQQRAKEAKPVLAKYKDVITPIIEIKLLLYPLRLVHWAF